MQRAGEEREVVGTNRKSNVYGPTAKTTTKSILQLKASVNKKDVEAKVNKMPLILQSIPAIIWNEAPSALIVIARVIK